jgi:hypothetical protein
MPLCGFGCFCSRAIGHTGAHTASPPPSTRRWDEQQHAREILRHLDFETPAYADLLDPE